MKRERAVLLLIQMLQTLDQCKSARPLSLVTGVYVFGSFARGALEPHDVDVDIEYEPDWDWGAHVAICLSSGRDPHGPMKRMLIGGERGCQFQFNFRDRADFGMTLLWHRDDMLQMALDRLQEIRPDPAAGRALRDAMLPQFQGLDEWIPLAFREVLIGAGNKGAITLERVVLDDGEIASAVARDHILDRWRPASPLTRAATAVISDWERRGIDPGHGHLLGSDIRDQSTPYFAGFGLRYFRAISRCLTEYGGLEWTEVIRPTRTRPLDALRIHPRDLRSLEQASWS